MGKITALRSRGETEFCVVGDHAYLKLNHAELVDVVDALHRSGKLALEKRLRVVLAAQATPLLRHDHG